MMLRAIKILGKRNFKDEIVNALEKAVDDILNHNLDVANNRTTGII